MGPVPAVARTRHAVRPYLRHGECVLVACSGGPDSVALAAAVAFEASRAGARAGLVTVDHGVQDGSAEQAQRVLELGRRLGLNPLESVRVEVGRAGGPEGAARDARYAALGRVAESLTCPSGSSTSGGGAALPGVDMGVRVLLGHTRDDQAESVLLGLGRGSGPRSIAGMRAVDGRWVRPFLGLERATTLDACAAQDLPTWHDPHNRDDRFVRVRVRHEVLPLLEDVLHGGVAASLARTAELLREDLDGLDAWADEAYHAALVPQPTRCTTPAAGDQGAVLVEVRPDRPVDHPTLAVGPLRDLPRAVRTRVLRRWASGCGAGPLTFGHTAALDALVVAWCGQGPVPLPGGVAARTRSATLGFVPNAPQPSQQE